MIWNYKKSVIVLPVTALVLLLGKYLLQVAFLLYSFLAISLCDRCHLCVWRGEHFCHSSCVAGSDNPPQYEMMDPATLASLHRWRMAQSILTIWYALLDSVARPRFDEAAHSINVYCTGAHACRRMS